MVSLTIDGRQIEAEEGSLLLDVLREEGIDVPTLCHVEGLEGYGGCRLCMVAIEGSKTGIAAACVTPVAEGQVINSSTPEILALRRTILEMLLAVHPTDCFNCKKLGDCKLHEYCSQYGVVKIETGLEIRDCPPDVSNPFISLDRNKCVLCGACVRICERLQCSEVLTFALRGRGTRVSPAFDHPQGI
jgi:NADH dehydrogenase/NADH:ubiquinone oxidoreductase subunit G